MAVGIQRFETGNFEVAGSRSVRQTAGKSPGLWSVSPVSMMSWDIGKSGQENNTVLSVGTPFGNSDRELLCPFDVGRVTDINGAGFRGGNWNNSTDNLRASDRNNAANVNGNRNNNYGFRAVRPASSGVM